MTRTKRLISVAAASLLVASGAAFDPAPATASASGCSAQLRESAIEANSHYAVAKCTTLTSRHRMRAVLYVNLGNTKYGPWVYGSGDTSTTDKHRYGVRAGYEVGTY